MPAWSRHRIVFRSPLAGLSLAVAFVMVFAIACGGEDDPAPTATTAPAPAAAAATDTPTPPEPTPTNTPAPRATATTAPPTATTAAASAATPTTGSSGQDYGEDYGESPTETPVAEPTEEPTQEPADEPGEPEEISIPIQGFAYRPAEITVPVGTTITWTNMDSAPHTATADDGSWNTGTLGQGESASITFDTPGTYPYFCAVHPSMRATVIVTGE